MINDSFARWILTPTIMFFPHRNTTRNPFRLSRFHPNGIFCLFLLSLRHFFFFLPSFLPLFFFQTKFFSQLFSDRCLRELRFMESPGTGNYKRPRIFRGISHTSNVVTPQTLELLGGWKSWTWEILEV